MSISRTPRGRDVLNLSLVAFLVIVLEVRTVFAGAWVREQNKAYVELAFSYFEAAKVFDVTGQKIPNALLPVPGNPGSAIFGLLFSTYRQYDGSLYLEYGLGWDLEFMASFPFYRLAQQDTDQGKFEVSGTGDAIVGVKYNWFKKDWLVSSFEVDLGIPAGDETAMGSVPTKNDQPIPLGDGEWDVAFRFLASRSFYPIPAYVSADFGFRARTSANGVDYDHDLPWSIDGGYTFSLRENENAWLSRLTPTVAFRGLISTKNATLSILQSQTATGNAPNQEFGNVEGGFSLSLLKKVSLFSVYSYTLFGENTGAGWSIRSGLGWET